MLCQWELPDETALQGPRATSPRLEVERRFASLGEDDQELVASFRGPDRAQHRRHTRDDLTPVEHERHGASIRIDPQLRVAHEIL
jgi:hypothetical protein